MSFSDAETVERLHEGIKKAASRAKELGALKKDKKWTLIHKLLLQIHENAKELLNAEPLSENDRNSMLDARIPQRKPH